MSDVVVLILFDESHGSHGEVLATDEEGSDISSSLEGFPNRNISSTQDWEVKRSKERGASRQYLEQRTVDICQDVRY